MAFEQQEIDPHGSWRRGERKGRNRCGGLVMAMAVLFTHFAPCSTARAYLTDSNDARTVPLGNLELEIQPLGYWHSFHEDGGYEFIAPSATLYVGLSDWMDAIVMGRGYVGGEASYYAVDGVAALFRFMLRRGSYDEGGAAGPSLALQVGAYFPGYDNYGYRPTWGLGDWGMTVALLGSHEGENIAVHVNAQFDLRDGLDTMATFNSVVLEGPLEWSVRPIIEVYGDLEFGDFLNLSALLGFVADVSESWAIMGGVRAGDMLMVLELEFRLSIWTSFTLLRPSEHSAP